jgi:hypothetical protein
VREKEKESAMWKKTTHNAVTTNRERGEAGVFRGMSVSF